MADKIILVTAPDDVDIDGIRICLVDLSKEQGSLVSAALQKYDGIVDIVVYVQTTVTDIRWILDKRHRSELTIFNADSLNQTLVGYFAAQPNSYYFGTLRDLNRVNNRVLYTEEDCLAVLNSTIGRYERKFQ